MLCVLTQKHVLQTLLKRAKTRPASHFFTCFYHLGIESKKDFLKTAKIGSRKVSFSKGYNTYINTFLSAPLFWNNTKPNKVYLPKAKNNLFVICVCSSCKLPSTFGKSPALCVWVKYSNRTWAWIQKFEFKHLKGVGKLKLFWPFLWSASALYNYFKIILSYNAKQ